MYQLLYPILSLVIMVTLLYFLSRYCIDSIYLTLKRIIKNDSLVYIIISLIFFPGTVLHELSHALMAKILFLKVLQIKLFPEWKNKTIKLGMVTYIKRDRLSSIIVGIAPLLGGICLLAWIATMKIFPNHDWRITLILGYLIFVVSSTMFSSKQDLVDAGFAIPFIIAALIGFYWIYTNTDLSTFKFIIPTISYYLMKIDEMLFITVGCQIIASLLLLLFRSL